MKRKLEDEGVKVKMYARYVDCTTIACEKMDAKVEGEADNETTMKWTQKIAYTIHKSIQVTMYHPSNHVNERMPVLDYEHWMEQVEVEGESKHQILHSHYIKEIASRNAIDKKSALSVQAKISILIADLV